MSAKIVGIDGREYQNAIHDGKRMRDDVCAAISKAYGDARKGNYTKCVVILSNDKEDVMFNNSLTYSEQIALLELAKLNTYKALQG